MGEINKKKTGELYLVETPLSCFHAPKLVKKHLQMILDRSQIIAVLITEEDSMDKNSEAFIATRVRLNMIEIEGKTEENKKRQMLEKARKVFMDVFSRRIDRGILLGITKKENMNKSKITKLSDTTIPEKSRKDIDG